MSDSRAAYEAWHAALGVDADASSPWHQLLKPHLRLGGCRVLEIASGRGGFAVWMATRAGAERPHQVVAADFALSALRLAHAFSAEVASARASEQRAPLAFAQADIMRLPFPPGVFNAVVSCETLEHVPDPVQAVREMFRVLAPGGTLYLTMPNYFGTLGIYRWYRERTGRVWTEGGQPINHPLRSYTMRRWLIDAGFTIAAVYGAGHFIPVPGGQPRSLRALDGIGALRMCAQHVAFVAVKPVA